MIVAVSAIALVELVRWALIDAVWTGTSGKDCVGHNGACWIFLGARTQTLMFGAYPATEQWRVVAALVLVAAGSLALRMMGRHLLRLYPLVLTLAASSLAIGILIYGGIGDLPVVPTSHWGGAMLTIIIAAWTIATALPLGLLLALARRSELPLISLMTGACIDLMRSLPLVGILFLMIVMFPLFVPPGVETDKLMRVMVAFTLFNAANFAEVFRGGLAAIPNGQIEAGRSLGLSKWQVTGLLVVPQAITITIPALVNLCVALIKETTIVLIVGLIDVVAVLQIGMSDPDWLTAPSVRTTAYVFAAAVFWAICFGLSRYSRTLERRTRR
ncbi:MAG: amino acid ABC transporter permease [Candidatus Eremiobacteraeota bacterium]|nr:amino acid ABC transporter permease [Candidatus Eremiobacteraeota bacterium]